MTQSLLGFNDLPFGSQLQVPTGDRGQQLYGQAVDPNALVGASTLFAQTRYVAKNGVDATADGSIAKPFLTVQAAITNITDAAVAKPYGVIVMPGVYADSFKLKANVYVIGQGRGSGTYNGTPREAPVVIAPNAAQLLDATFAGAGDAGTGIMHCAVSTAIVANFAAIASTAAKTIMLQDILTESAIQVTGSGSAESLTCDGVEINALTFLTVTDMGEVLLTNTTSDFGAGPSLHQSVPVPTFFTITGSLFGTAVVTWTSAALANSMIIACTGRFSTQQPTLSGIGILCVADQRINLVMTDAGNRPR